MSRTMKQGRAAGLQAVQRAKITVRQRVLGGARRGFLGRGGGVFSVAAALCTVLLAAGCAVEKPQMPRSAIVLRVPVANDTTALSEIVEEESNYLALREDGSIALQYNREFTDLQGRTEVGDRLAVTPPPVRFATPIGEIEIPGREFVLPPIAAGGLLPGELLGQQVRIPEEASLASIEVEVPLAGIESLDVASGSLTMEIANGLPLALVDLDLALVDKGGGRIVQTAGIDRIESGGTGSVDFDLAGKKISGDLAVLLRHAGLEAEAETVTLRADDALGITLLLGRLSVHEATGVIEPQVVAPAEPAVLEFLDDRIQLTRAVIESGNLALILTNELPVAMEVTLELLEMIDAATGSPATRVIGNLEQGTPQEVVFHLDGHVFRPRDPLAMRVGYEARTQPDGQAVTIRSDAGLLVEAVPEKLTFGEISGRLNRLPLPTIDPLTRHIDLLTGAETINAVAFDSAGMNVTYTTAVGAPVTMALRVIGADSAIPDSAGLERTLGIEVEMEPGSPADPATRTIDVAPDRLRGFLNFLPTQVTVHTDSVLIGRGVAEEDTALVRSDHWVRLDDVAFVAPARLRADTSYFESNPRSQGAFTDAEARRRINANIDGAVVTTTVLNKTPLAIGVRLFTAYDPDLVFSEPVLTLPKERGEYFSVEPDAPAIRPVSLSADDLRLLLDIDPDDPGPAAEGSQVRTLYSGVKVRLAAPKGDQIYGDDIVVVQAHAEIFLELSEALFQ